MERFYVQKQAKTPKYGTVICAKSNCRVSYIDHAQKILCSLRKKRD